MPEVLSLMCVHAHPDDEVLGTGGTLAKYSEEQVLTSLIVATRGEVGEMRDPHLRLAPYETLADVRSRELAAAATILRLNFVNFLGYRDSGMAGTADNFHYASFVQADMDEACRRLVLNIRKLKPQVIVTYDENGGYGHPDHIMCNRVAHASFQLAGDPNAYWDDGEEPWQPQKLYHIAFSRSNFRRAFELMRAAEIPNPFEGADLETFGRSDEAITTRIDVSEYVGRARQALACHRSQISGVPWLNVPNDIWAVGFGEECFIRVISLVDAPEHETDLFAGLRQSAVPATDYSLLHAQPVGTHFVA